MSAGQPEFIRRQYEFAAHIRDPDNRPAPQDVETLVGDHPTAPVRHGVERQQSPARAQRARVHAELHGEHRAAGRQRGLARVLAFKA